MFLLHGLAIGTWLARIPSVQERLSLGEAALGFALLGSGLGSLVAMLPAGALIARFGSRGMIALLALPWALSVALIGLAADGATLFGALVLVGLGGRVVHAPATVPSGFGETVGVAERLFTAYLLPFELTSLLLLVAVVGAVAIAKRRP